MSTMILDQHRARPAQLPRRVQMARPSSVRLTRRGRLSVFVASLFLVLAAGVWIAAGSVATQEPAATEVVMVGSGDTLWGIASDLADSGDTRAMVEKIQELNSLDSGALAIGQELKVPAS